MSYQPNGGGYLPTPYGTQNGGSPGDRSPKRQKLSPPASTPTVTFKTPPAPANRPFQSQAPSQQMAKQQDGETVGGKRTDVSDLGDLLFNSGVNEKEEEEFLLRSYQRSHQSGAAPRSLAGEQGYSLQQPTNFDLLSSGSFPSIGQRPGLLGPAVKSEEDIAKELEEKHRLAIREYNERSTRELEDPFLWGNSMRFRMERIANDNGIKIPMAGLFDKIDRNKLIENRETKDIKHKDEGGGSIQMEKAPSILNKGVALDSIMSLLSLAANERIRGLVDDAYALARGRQFGSDGKVPDDWADLAAPPQQLDTQLTNGDASHTSSTKPHQSISTADFLTQLALADRKAEEARLKKRAERRARKEAAAAKSTAATTNGDAPNALADSSGNTPGPANLVAPEAKLTKKERERLAKQDVSEEASIKNANDTVRMMSGLGKKYSWLNPGAGKGGASRAGTPRGASRGGTPGPSTPGKPNATKDGLPSKALDRKFGTWREDGREGEDVQLRDWVNALEIDGKEKRSHASAMQKLGRERLLDGVEQA